MITQTLLPGNCLISNCRKKYTFFGNSITDALGTPSTIEPAGGRQRLQWRHPAGGQCGLLAHGLGLRPLRLEGLHLPSRTPSRAHSPANITPFAPEIDSIVILVGYFENLRLSTIFPVSVSRVCVCVCVCVCVAVSVQNTTRLYSLFCPLTPACIFAYGRLFLAFLP